MFVWPLELTVAVVAADSVVAVAVVVVVVAVAGQKKVCKLCWNQSINKLLAKKLFLLRVKNSQIESSAYTKKSKPLTKYNRPRYSYSDLVFPILNILESENGEYLQIARKFFL